MKITVLDRPVMTYNLEGQYYLLRDYAIEMKKIIATGKITKKRKYRGHYSVTRSLVEGLKKIEVNFTYDPQDITEVGDVLVVLANLDALRQAINLKKAGKITKIIAGPNITSLPTDIINLSLCSYIDLCILHGQWLIEWWYHVVPNFPVPISVWFAGVNSEFWQPCDPQPKTILKRVLLYQKYVSDDFTNQFKKKAEFQGLETQVIKYGKYTLEEYKTMLNWSDIMVFLSPSETQGIALFECWSCNVPSLVWNPGICQWKGYMPWEGASSAPYLSELTGRFFREIEDFDLSLEKMKNEFSFFRPREWILNYGTDEIAAHNLLNLIARL
ncbi:hypothetical protein [Oscillatoria acuminata]|nr:hypothetical protein [Oscillatoria acuminata]